MPSSLIFAGLVVLWLLILVPAVARHQHVVARPSVAALSGRVLTRPQGPVSQGPVSQGPVSQGPVSQGPVSQGPPEEDDVQDTHDDRADAPEFDDGWEPEPDAWERPVPRYRPGRGGYDPDAADLAARTRYAFRQRVVLGLLAAAVVTAGFALLVSGGLWWLHLLVDAALVGYLVYLRRQVRMEESIRARRAARMAGTRHPSAAEDPELAEWARRRRDSTAPVVVDDGGYDDAEDVPEETVDEDDSDRVYGTGEPAGPLRDRPGRDTESALPRLAPAPPPPPPAGTTVVEADPDLHDLDLPVRPDRRAVG